MPETMVTLTMPYENWKQIKSDLLNDYGLAEEDVEVLQGITVHVEQTVTATARMEATDA